MKDLVDARSSFQKDDQYAVDLAETLLDLVL